MSASPPVLPTTTTSIDNHLEDEEKLEEPPSDANTMVEKNENEPQGNLGAEVAEEDQLAANEYPEGIQFVFILLALMLSVFMVALDMVGLAL